MFGCYRRGDANDPDTYCAAVAATLSRFPQAVVEYVTDPRTGIPGSIAWLPSVAEVKSACMSRQSYVDKIADYDARFTGRKPLPALPPNTRSPGRRANVFVHAAAPQYKRACDLAKDADPADWKHDPQGRAGIWIALNLLERERQTEKFKPLSAADLANIVGQEAFDKIPNSQQEAAQ